MTKSFAAFMFSLICLSEEIGLAFFADSYACTCLPPKLGTLLDMHHRLIVGLISSEPLGPIVSALDGLACSSSAKGVRI